MKRLVVVEIRRFLARRLFLGLTALVAVAFSAAGTIAFVASDDSPAAVERMRERRAEEVAECVEHTRLAIRFDTDEVSDAARRDPRAFCEREIWTSDPRFQYSELSWILRGLGLPPFMILGWLLGASFIGAEWSHRTMTAMLTWEPRRRRVLAAKVAAVAGVLFVWFVLLQIFFAAAMYPAALFEGTFRGIDQQWWTEIAGVVARVAGLGTLAGVFGASLATIGRNTAAAFGGGFIYLAVVERLIHVFKPSWSDWLIGDNAALILIGGREVDHLGHGEPAAALLLVTYAAVIFGGALVLFRRRDLA